MSATITATKTTQVVTSASTPIRELGICTTCNHVKSCLFAKAMRNPIWNCDEFDSSAAAAAPVAVTPSPKTDERHYGEAVREGLCVNCESRTSCAHRKPGITVLECEDYS